MAHIIDVIERDVFDTHLNHSQRVTYSSLLIGKKLNFSDEDLFDLASYALLHDIGISSQDILSEGKYRKIYEIEKKKDHCRYGEQIIASFPFINPKKNIVKYHHEFYNGKGYYGIPKEAIPPFCRIISLVDELDTLFNPKKALFNERTQLIIKDYITNNIKVLFFEDEANALLSVMDQKFFEEINRDNFDSLLLSMIPKINVTTTYQGIQKLVEMYANIINSKTEYTYTHTNDLISKVNILLDYYQLSEKDRHTLIIASHLHDIGKLGISNDILEKPGKLTEDEFAIIKTHPEMGYNILKDIVGFSEVANLVYSHHEKLNGKGYPRGLKAHEINFNTRLLTCLDIYQSLVESRPYRKGFTHQEAINIMNDMVNKNEIDGRIVRDIDNVFTSKRAIILA